MQPTSKLGPILAFAACYSLAACASRPHVIAVQKAQIPPAPRTLMLVVDQGERLPFGIAPEIVADAAGKAGFVTASDASRYRLILTAAFSAPNTGSYTPPDGAARRPIWVTRPDRSLRARFAGGQVLRVTAVLVDGQDNRETWRGTGTLLTRNPQRASELVRHVLARLPRG